MSFKGSAFQKILTGLIIFNTVGLVGILGGGFYAYKYVTSDNFEKLIIELRYPYDQGNTDGNTDTKLDDFEQTVKNGKLLKTTAENDQANEINSLPQKEKTLESVIETLDERAKKNPNDVINGMINKREIFIIQVNL